jgi:hypothetical protein
MEPRKLTEDQLQLVVNALRVAAEQWTKDSETADAEAGAGWERLADGFRSQAAEAEALAEEIERLVERENGDTYELCLCKECEESTHDFLRVLKVRTSVATCDRCGCEAAPQRDHRCSPLVDERNYSVVGINGFRRGSLVRDEALRLAARMREEMARAGWRGDVVVYYRDGSVVKEGER